MSDVIQLFSATNISPPVEAIAGQVMAKIVNGESRRKVFFAPHQNTTSSRAEVISRRSRVANMLRAGVSKTDIASELGISKQVLSQDLRAISEWSERRTA